MFNRVNNNNNKSFIYNNFKIIITIIASCVKKIYKKSKLYSNNCYNCKTLIVNYKTRDQIFINFWRLFCNYYITICITTYINNFFLI